MNEILKDQYTLIKQSHQCVDMDQCMTMCGLSCINFRVINMTNAFGRLFSYLKALIKVATVLIIMHVL